MFACNDSTTRLFSPQNITFESCSSFKLKRYFFVRALNREIRQVSFTLTGDLRLSPPPRRPFSKYTTREATLPALISLFLYLSLPLFLYVSLSFSLSLSLSQYLRLSVYFPVSRSVSATCLSSCLSVSLRLLSFPRCLTRVFMAEASSVVAVAVIEVRVLADTPIASTSSTTT